MTNQKASESSVDELVEDRFFFFFDLFFRWLFFRLRLGESSSDDEASSTVMSVVNSVPSFVVSDSESQTKYNSIAWFGQGMIFDRPRYSIQVKNYEVKTGFQTKALSEVEISIYRSILLRIWFISASAGGSSWVQSSGRVQWTIRMWFHTVKFAIIFLFRSYYRLCDGLIIIFSHYLFERHPTSTTQFLMGMCPL